MAQNTPMYRITDLQEDDRPRERLAKHGPSALSNPELLAILLRVGVPGENAVQVATRLLQHYRGLIGLHRADFSDVCAQHGLGMAKAAQIKAALELGDRLRKELPDNEPITIHSPTDAANLLMHEMSSLDQEELRVMLLNTRNHVIEVATIYRGSVNTSQVRISEVFKPAVRKNATSILVAHNHPSGDPTPSPDDIAITRLFVQAGKLLDIEVLDHLVIGINKWTSLKERGLGFS